MVQVQYGNYAAWHSPSVSPLPTSIQPQTSAHVGEAILRLGQHWGTLTGNAAATTNRKGCAYGSRKMATNQQPEFGVPRIVHCGQFSFGCFHVCVTVFITGFWRLVQYQLSLSIRSEHMWGVEMKTELCSMPQLFLHPRGLIRQPAFTAAKVLNQPLISPGQGCYSSSDNSEKT